MNLNGYLEGFYRMPNTTDSITTPTAQEVSRYASLKKSLDCGERYDEEFRSSGFNERVKLLVYLDERARTSNTRAKNADSDTQRAIASARRQVEQAEALNRRHKELWPDLSRTPSTDKTQGERN